MAYAPVEQGRLLRDQVLKKIAESSDATPAQVALAWLLQHPGICAIPKAGTARHVIENHDTLQVRLTPRDLAALDAAFPPPRRKVPLEMI
jgi:diketogulonate reductase-like aldo/keto reductase